MSKGLARGPIWNLTLLRLRELWRQPGTLFWVFGFPLVLAVGLGLAFPEPGPSVVKVGLTPEVPEEAANRLRHAGLSVRRVGLSEADGELGAERLNAVVSKSARPGVDFTVRVDPRAREAELGAALVRAYLERGPERIDHLVVEKTELSLKPGTRYIDFLIPGLIGMNLMTGALWGVGWSLVDLRTRRLLQRLRASPVKPIQLLVSVALSRLLVIPLEVLLLVAFGHWVFGVKVAGSLLLLAVVVLAGSLAFSGLGVLLSGRAENNETISGLINLVTLPMLMGSGIFFATSHFPAGLRKVVAFLPLSALNDALRGIINHGAALTDLKMPLAILGVWAIATFLAGFRLFRWA